MKSFCATNVVGLPVIVEVDKKMEKICRKKLRLKNIGRISTGERYMIYRIAIYADGFQKNKCTKQSKSVGGIYMLPLGLPLSGRRSMHAARPLCVTAPGSSIKKAL